MPDQIFAAGPLPAPLKYNVPGSQRMIPRACQALFDGSGASGDYVPALIFRSQAGHVIARAILDSTVTAGDDAEVSWFPGVKHAPTGVSSAFLNQSRLYQKRTANQAITSGVVTAITFQTFTSVPGYTPGLFGQPVVVQNPVTFADFGAGVFMLVVNFEAAAYDRYIELTIANPSIPESSVSPRVRESVSPDGDRLTLAAVIAGGTGPATTVTANVFQASGVNRNITAEWEAIDVHGRIFLA